ncbi:MULTISPECIES: endonuclease/exonuclease/phosphatase family protein [unclassified Methanoregula]|uniref:endonuclease/exonuclease/phosphatase family protein n=1 Tax=unclassified Methanoregula TaxID=2649730 RepID=UPI0009D480EE|nr:MULTISPECIES: endonuclease/exonuclease/phosphatase family protein [unclassified Methanoregula]OPX63754.1 MAG: Endonuclease/Exonuclease/phosphatase family protein [Methanoregula sp. PtaB.Bin085]OPY35107.1 MAG: Endonuclease/Exonuclease/phosphatase family protein [Methanoregula sp. PtaU1.Bin006]
MTLRIATFNVENLFDRPAAMNLEKWEDGQKYINDCATLNLLLNKDTYTAKDKEDILKGLEEYGLDRVWGKSEFLELKKIRGRLLRYPKNKPAEVVATGRKDWVGWVELTKKHIDDEAIRNTARVIAEVNPDIIVLVEVENRPTLIRFHDWVLKPIMTVMGLEPYPHLMLIDGNDARGIDVCIMSRLPIIRMVSHVDDRTAAGTPTFSRDCPEYYLDAGNGTVIVILPNHFASKGSDAKGNRRRVQAAAVKGIYENLKKSYPYIIIAGDFNDFPAGGSLGALLDETDLKDAMHLPAYKGEYRGTYQTATDDNKIDYLLLSPELQGKVRTVDVNRRGYYAPTKWKSFDNLTSKTKDRLNASDHHLVWADLEL